MSYKRLEFIANLVKKNDKVLDVGTDHCIVPILLLKNKITNNVDASDINEKPLEIAKNNLIKQGLENKVNLILTNGLKGIKTKDYNLIIIAGMGGKTISKIIEETDYRGRYILHATTSIPFVRSSISKIGMGIIDEHIIKEKNIFNVILEVGDKEHKLLEERDLFMGPILQSKNTKIINEYYNYLYDKLENNSKLSKNKNLMKNEREWLKNWLWKKKN